ncbi:hypothetical protein GCM10010191_46590 [Actinomadura vinacea]|uniref:Uncharacterized protein n=1 Tax=Actinomadura vinacea TaxID=115336 RepID=A0ABN3JEK9_9ACTN
MTMRYVQNQESWSVAEFMLLAVLMAAFREAVLHGTLITPRRAAAGSAGCPGAADAGAARTVAASIAAAPIPTAAPLDEPIRFLPH